MFVFVILLGVLSALFSALAETQRPTKNPLRLIPVPVVGPALFYLIYALKDVSFLAPAIGLIYIFISFVQLGVIGRSQNMPAQPVIHFILICALAALSGLAWHKALWGPVSFFVSFAILVPTTKKVNKFKGKSLEKVKELLELSGIINSIFIFIIGLIIASDRVRFLKKIAQWLFN